MYPALHIGFQSLDWPLRSQLSKCNSLLFGNDFLTMILAIGGQNGPDGIRIAF